MVSFSLGSVSFLLISVFIIATLGYMLGRITIKGVSLGTAGVFIVALAYGAVFGAEFTERIRIGEVAYASEALKTVENLGLILFGELIEVLTRKRDFGVAIFIYSANIIDLLDNVFHIRRGKLNGVRHIVQCVTALCITLIGN